MLAQGGVRSTLCTHSSRTCSTKSGAGRGPWRTSAHGRTPSWHPRGLTPCWHPRGLSRRFQQGVSHPGTPVWAGAPRDSENGAPVHHLLPLDSENGVRCCECGWIVCGPC